MTQTVNQMIAVAVDLIEMDRRVLSYLVEHGGRVAYAGLPSKLFAGEMPTSHPNMVDLGLVEHDGDDIVITELGRTLLI